MKKIISIVAFSLLLVTALNAKEKIQSREISEVRKIEQRTVKVPEVRKVENRTVLVPKVREVQTRSVLVRQAREVRDSREVTSRASRGPREER